MIPWDIKGRRRRESQGKGNIKTKFRGKQEEFSDRRRRHWKKIKY